MTESVELWVAGLEHEREMRRIALDAAIKFEGLKVAAGSHGLVCQPETLVRTAEKFYDYLNREELAVATEPDSQ